MECQNGTSSFFIPLSGLIDGVVKYDPLPVKHGKVCYWILTSVCNPTEGGKTSEAKILGVF